MSGSRTDAAARGERIERWRSWAIISCHPVLRSSFRIICAFEYVLRCIVATMAVFIIRRVKGRWYARREAWSAHATCPQNERACCTPADPLAAGAWRQIEPCFAYVLCILTAASVSWIGVRRDVPNSELFPPSRGRLLAVWVRTGVLTWWKLRVFVGNVSKMPLRREWGWC